MVRFLANRNHGGCMRKKNSIKDFVYDYLANSCNIERRLIKDNLVIGNTIFNLVLDRAVMRWRVKIHTPADCELTVLSAIKHIEEAISNKSS